jgi:hypothetical protein
VKSQRKDTPDYDIKIFEKHFEKPDSISERYIERILYKHSKFRYQFIHCNLVDIDHTSRNFTTRKYTSEIKPRRLDSDEYDEMHTALASVKPLKTRNQRG